MGGDARDGGELDGVGHRDPFAAQLQGDGDGDEEGDAGRAVAQRLGGARHAVAPARQPLGADQERQGERDADQAPRRVGSDATQHVPGLQEVHERRGHRKRCPEARPRAFHSKAKAAAA